MTICIRIQISCVCPIYCLNIWALESFKWAINKEPDERNRGSKMSVHVNLLNKFGKTDKM